MLLKINQVGIKMKSADKENFSIFLPTNEKDFKLKIPVINFKCNMIT